MSEPYIGEVRIFGGSFAPKGWAMCDGQLLPIAQNTALFSLLGTTYGGDGRVNFGLPNLKGRFPMHKGFGPGLTPRELGEMGGEASHTLTVAEMPPHTHQMYASKADADTQAATGALLANPKSPQAQYHDAVALAPMPSGSLGLSGSGQPHSNRQPFLALNFIIAVQGIYPSRN